MRKIISVFCIVLVIGLLSSCGKYGKVQNEIDEIKVENALPEANAGAVTLEEIKEAVYAQQLGLCSMYIDAYKQTDSEAFILKYPDLDKNKLLSLLNDAREDINKDNRQSFEENIAVLLTDVTDCTNMLAYVKKCEDEVIAFYDDYRKFNQASPEQYTVLCDILLKYFELGNSLADMFLQKNQEQFTEAAIAAIEKNAEATKDFRVSVNKNNEIIEVLNSVYGGVNSQGAQRINTANKALVVKLLNSMETLTDSERKSLLDQLEKGEDLTLEIEKTPLAGSAAAGNARR